MTKTLTEQWCEGKLQEGWYYCHCYDKVKKLYCGDGESLELEDPETSTYYFFHRENGKGQVEVLAPVPSYDEWRAELASNDELLTVQKRLEKKLAIAKKVLKRYSKDDYYSEGGGRSVNPYPHIARKALKKMEDVK